MGIRPTSRKPVPERAKGAIPGRHISADEHLSVELLKAKGRTRNIRKSMARQLANRCVFVRVVCVLSMALVCAMGVVQAVHAHPENSTASHHGCSICVTAHGGLSVETVTAAPVLVAVPLAAPAREFSDVLRPASTHFIRPPPAF